MTNPTPKQPDSELDRCMKALYLELPESVADDVNRIVYSSIAAAVAEARIEGAANILKIFQRNHGLSDAQYADMMTTVSSWKLQARQTPATTPKSQPEETNQKQHPDDWMQYGMEL